MKEKFIIQAVSGLAAGLVGYWVGGKMPSVGFYGRLGVTGIFALAGIWIGGQGADSYTKGEEIQGTDSMATPPVLT